MRAILASVALATVGLSNSAVAQNFDEPVTEIVSYADLDLTKNAGMSTFDSRVRSAADSLCRDPGIVPIRRARLESQCVASVIKSAHNQLRSEGVSTAGTTFAAR